VKVGWGPRWFLRDSCLGTRKFSVKILVTRDVRPRDVVFGRREIGGKRGGRCENLTKKCEKRNGREKKMVK